MKRSSHGQPHPDDFEDFQQFIAAVIPIAAAVLVKVFRPWNRQLDIEKAQDYVVDAFTSLVRHDEKGDFDQLSDVNELFLKIARISYNHGRRSNRSPSHEVSEAVLGTPLDQLKAAKGNNVAPDDEAALEVAAHLNIALTRVIAKLEEANPRYARIVAVYLTAAKTGEKLKQAEIAAITSTDGDAVLQATVSRAIAKFRQLLDDELNGPKRQDQT